MQTKIRVAFRVACVAFLQVFCLFFKIFELNIKQRKPRNQAFWPSYAVFTLVRVTGLEPVSYCLKTA